MKILTFVGGGILVALIGSQLAARGADDPKVDALLARQVEALGGKPAIERLTNFVQKATGEGMGMAMQMDAWAQAPNLQSSRVEITGLGVMREGFDGRVAWAQSPFEGSTEKSGADLAKKQRDSEFFLPLEMKRVYPTLRYAGTEKSGDQTVEMLEAKLEGGAVERFGFDPKTGLLVKRVSESETAQGRIRAEVSLEDYRVVDGLKRPFLIRLHLEPAGQAAIDMQFKITEIKHNVPIAASVFSKPKEKE